jgi:hypothetical protein
MTCMMVADADNNYDDCQRIRLRARLLATRCLFAIVTPLYLFSFALYYLLLIFHVLVISLLKYIRYTSIMIFDPLNCLKCNRKC